MVAGVAYSSFAFRPLWHPPLVRNASVAIQNTIPMESMKTLEFVLFLSTRQQITENNNKYFMGLLCYRKKSLTNESII